MSLQVLQINFCNFIFFTFFSDGHYLSYMTIEKKYLLFTGKWGGGYYGKVTKTLHYPLTYLPYFPFIYTTTEEEFEKFPSLTSTIGSKVALFTPFIDLHWASIGSVRLYLKARLETLLLDGGNFEYKEESMQSILVDEFNQSVLSYIKSLKR